MRFQIHNKLIWGIIFLFFMSLVAAGNPQGKSLFIKKGCSKCHGPLAIGGSLGPDITGNSFEYYYETLLEIKQNKLRDIYPTMSNYLKDISEKEIHSIAEFLSKL